MRSTGTMMTFDSDIRHWKTIAEFAAHLQTIPRPKWCSGLVHHNTYQPNETNWAGMQSMQSMMAYYRDVKKWSSAPHLFLVAAAPKASDCGIWQMTPITRPGTHAGVCNAHSLGLESCGDFDARPPTADQYTLLIMVTRLIMERWGLPPEKVSCHRDCMPRTCPGKYLTGTQIRDTLNTPLPPRPDIWDAWGPIGRPMGVVETYAVPRAWLVNKKLGACVTPETFHPSGLYSVATFKHGIILFLKGRKTTIIEMF